MPTTFANTINGNEILAKRSQCDYAGNDIQQTYATKSEVTTDLSSKQDTISDLATIRSGAQAGATAVQPGDLATVATTGAYSDLSGTPTIPTATSDLTNDSGFITLSDVPAQVNADWDAVSGAAEILNKPTIPSGSDLVPPYSIPADEGKVLTIGSSTTYWAAPAAGGVTDVEVDGVSVVSQGVASITMPTVDQTFDSTSADAQSGVAIAGELATINQVPASTSADSGKVLTVDSSGIPGWVTGGSGSTGLFEAVYGVTTYADVVQAISDQKIVYCRVSPSGASRMAFLAYIGSSNVEFQYYRSLSNHSASNQTDEVYVYTVSSSGWTTTTRLAGIKYIAGTNMSQSYNSSNSTLTFNATMPTVDQTYDGTSANAQSGTAVAGAIAGVNQVPASTSSDSGKVLTVDSNGDPQWSTGGGGGGTQADWTEDDPTDPSYIENKPTPKTLTAGTGISITENSSTITIASTVTPPTVDQTYDASSTNAQSGVAVADAIGNLPTNLTAAQIQALKEALGCDETVLWEGSAASSFTVSETISNFEYLRVYMNYNGMNTWCYGTIVSSAQFTIACVGYANSSGDLNRLQMFGGSFTSSNGLAFSSEAGKCIYFANASNTIGGGATSACNIRKIVGVHRIASN